MSAPLDMAAVGALFGVSAATVARWRVRYRNTPTPCPEPAGYLSDRFPYWLDPQAWRDWHASRPGRGSGGGRPRRST